VTVKTVKKICSF